MDSLQDSFDRLPDDLVLSIFDKLRDARSLCLSMSACKRFHSITPRVVDIYLPLPHKKRAAPPRPQTLATIILKTLIINPFNLISNIFWPDLEDDTDLAFPNRILNPFPKIRALHLRLPQARQQEHGSPEVESRLRPGTQQLRHSRRPILVRRKRDHPRELLFLAEDDLKLRIVWTISCLIAASARHHLVQETVRALEKVESVLVSDESGQGRLCMNREEIVEMKGTKGKRGDYIEGCCSSECRSRVPALRMKMWFLERVETAGKVMEGATLVVIRPAIVGEGRVKGDGEMVAGAFGEDEEGIDEVVRKLMVANKCYTLEMNSF